MSLRAFSNVLFASAVAIVMVGVSGPVLAREGWGPAVAKRTIWLPATEASFRPTPAALRHSVRYGVAWVSRPNVILGIGY